MGARLSRTASAVLSAANVVNPKMSQRAVSFLNSMHAHNNCDAVGCRRLAGKYASSGCGSYRSEAATARAWTVARACDFKPRRRAWGCLLISLCMLCAPSGRFEIRRPGQRSVREPSRPRTDSCRNPS